MKEEGFLKALQNGDSFIALIETKNLTTEGHDEPMQSKLSKFLNDEYPYQFIWVTASRRSNRRNVYMSDFCSDYIQISDLNFGASRNDPIKALCPIADILTVFILEEKNKVSVLFKNNYLRIKKQRENQYLVPCLRYVNFFKTQDDNVNKENRKPSRPGTSRERSQPGKSGSQSKKSSSAVRNQSGPSGLNSGSSGFSTEVHGSQKSCTSSESPSQTSHENEHDVIESDESDDENNQTRKIKFSNLYAEITSKGITRKIEIGSFDYYPSLRSKVGFQIRIFQFILTITVTSF